MNMEFINNFDLWEAITSTACRASLCVNFQKINKLLNILQLNPILNWNSARNNYPIENIAGEKMNVPFKIPWNQWKLNQKITQQNFEKTISIMLSKQMLLIKCCVYSIHFIIPSCLLEHLAPENNMSRL